MTTIQDRIIKDFRKNIKPWIKKEGPYWPDWDKVEQFLIQSIKEVEKETRKEVETNKWCEITSRLENNYYIGLSRHSNDVYISIRNKGDGTKGSKGGVALQYKIDLEQTLSEISEDMDKRNTTTFNNLSITNKEIKK